MSKGTKVVDCTRLRLKDFCFREENYISKKVRVVCLARDMPIAPPLHPYQQTLHQTPQQIIRPRYKNTATIITSPIITRPAQTPASPESPPPKKASRKSPAAKELSIKYSADHYEEEYPLHEKYDLQEAVSDNLHGKDVAVIKAQRIPREEDELNVNLPIYFLHRVWKKNWLFIKGPTSIYYHEELYTIIEEIAGS